MEVENGVSRRGYNWQALPLAHMQKSTHFTWAHTKVNRVWFLGGKLPLFPGWFMCKSGTFALGQGGWLEIGATSLVWLLQIYQRPDVSVGVWGRNSTAEFKEFLPQALCCGLVPLTARFSKAYLWSNLSWSFFKKNLPSVYLRFQCNEDANKAEYFHAYFINWEIVHFSATCLHFYTNSS